MYSKASHTTPQPQQHPSTSKNAALMRDVRHNLHGIADEMNSLKKNNGSMKEENRVLTVQNGELTDRNAVIAQELTDMRKENQALNDEIDRLKATYEPQQREAAGKSVATPDLDPLTI